MKRPVQFSAPLAVVLLLLASLSAAAQSAPGGHGAGEASSSGCSGVASWYARIPDAIDLNTQLTTAPVDATDTNYVARLQILNPVASALAGDNAVPAAAEAAQKQIAAGYTSLISSITLWVQGFQSGAAGGVENISQVLNANVLQSQGRNQLVDGYRQRADLAASCAVGPGSATGTGCAAVKAWLAPAATYVSTMWQAEKLSLQEQEDAQATALANPGLDTTGGIIARPEHWTDFFYTQALSLAEIPAPAEAASVKQQLLGQLIGESDLYLLNILETWTTFLGADQATVQKSLDYIRERELDSFGRADHLANGLEHAGARMPDSGPIPGPEMRRDRHW